MNSNLTAVKPASRGRRLLLPLAGLLVLEALAVGTGAYFVSSSVQAATGIATGALKESKAGVDEAILTLSDLQSGDIVDGTLTITNADPMASTITLTEVTSDGFTDEDAVTLTITEQGAAEPVWSGLFGTLGSVELGDFAAEESRTFVFRTSLAPVAGPEDHGETATAEYTWSAVQVPAATDDR